MRSRTGQEQRTSLHTSTPAIGVLQCKCACGTHTGGGQCAAWSEEHQRLQRSATHDAEHTEVPPIVHEVLRSPGQPLDVVTRAFFEPRFGYDFSHVRVHTDAKAAESAQAVNARAYTVGAHIVLKQAAADMTKSPGAKLLAHELVHVIQQRASAHAFPGTGAIHLADRQFEHEADVAAGALLRGEGFVPGRSAVTRLAREAPDAGSTDPHSASPPKCTLDQPKDCRTYDEWLNTFPAAADAGEITSSMPADLVKLITGKLSARGGLPDCADVAFLLRHYFLRAHGQAFSFKVGRDKESATTYTLGKDTKDKEARACMIGAGTESFQEERAGFALVDFYKERGKHALNLKTLLAKGLKPGDMFVWKRRPTVRGNFQGHAQTVQGVSLPKTDPNDPKRITDDGRIALVQGTMEAGKGQGRIEQRVYTFVELTGKQDGGADIGEEPRLHEEAFYGAGPWRV